MVPTPSQSRVRQVFAFEGRGGFPVWATPGEATAPRRQRDASGRVIPERGRFSPAQVLNYWYDAVQAAGDCRWHYYAQNHWRRAIRDILRIAGKESTGGPGAGRDAVALLGFSNGGDAAFQTAWALDAQGIEVDLVVTADPVRKPLRGLGLLGFAKPAGVRAWHNFYQRCDRRTFARCLPAVGRSVAGADTDCRLTGEDFRAPMDPAFAHFWIPAHRLVLETITGRLREL